MIDIHEFLSLRKIPLDQKVIDEWQHESDPGFVAYVLEHHREFDYQHLRCAMRILQNINRNDVREFFSTYSDHPELAFRTLARASLEIHRQRGWISQLPAWA